ncbi:rhomboid family intramembrane serine protease [Candidatus Methylacidithermus pantelleriae]|uniref:Rhomboid family protein n=1 Tax=Candidatus Methylacidithermus pantelleriae TaxID=2744239 RepID=A0A8J2BSG4_9BACT|nr:rhomboid family intramembrane serine protease [Candidatus Methylacidithermus pantelleriae]CAF0695042.1 Rhomboid family protein [Candidatus Methylacidithermus pantelleriae]
MSGIFFGIRNKRIYHKSFLGHINTGMSRWSRPGEDGPLFWIGNQPVYVTGVLIGAHSLVFVLTALGQALGFAPLLLELALSTRAVVEEGKIWQLFTYIWLHRLSYWFPLEMLMLYWFGQEVERNIGRQKYLLLYVSLAVVPALLVVAVSWLSPAWDIVISGSDTVHFALFVAFAALFPSAELLFGVNAKWFAITFVTIQSLILLAQHSLPGLLMEWSSLGIAIAFTRIPVPEISFGWIQNWFTKRLQTLRNKRQESSSKGPNESESIDAILDKIAKSGMGSLTKAEKEALERARMSLLKRNEKK